MTRLSEAARQLVDGQIGVSEYLAELPPEQVDAGTARLVAALFKPPGVLTRREVRVLAAAADGLTDAEIAESFGVPVGTVKSQMKAACRRLGARGRTNAVQLATRRGFIG